NTVKQETVIKAKEIRTGKLVIEQTYKYIILIDVSNWNDSIVIEDGLFLASESQLKHKIAKRANFSSAALGGEGFFNLGLSGQGVVALESYIPREELIEVELE